MDIQLSLRRAVKRWKLFNQSDLTLADEQGLQCMESRETVNATILLEILGQEIFDGGKCRVLDVGCGESASIALMLGGVNIIQSPRVDLAVYHGIDIEDVAAKSLIRQQKIHDLKYFQFNVFEHDLSKDFNLDFYDLVIIDVEPHSKERQIYERIMPFMRTSHMVILKHIGDMDWFNGYAMWANIFLEHELHKSHLLDCFAECANGIRDVFLILSRDTVEYNPLCQGRGSPHVRTSTLDFETMKICGFVDVDI